MFSHDDNGQSHPQRLGSSAENVIRQGYIHSWQEPIAIIGLACRFPGAISKPSELWDFLLEGRSGQGRIPTTRFNASGIYHRDAEAPGSINTLGGYFLQQDIRSFDNAFFGINDIEAAQMDPQQRQLLEAVYECSEDAGIANLGASNTGCFVANFTNDFLNMQMKDTDDFHRYSATGFGTTILANRISHIFNLKGPSMVVDTACSSSLYALHLACQALLAGECDSAFVAGANLIQSPELHIAMVRAGVLSATSTSHTFDSSADGYGRGEGVAALYIKRLSDAVKDNDSIRAVIRATSINSNGFTPGITLPSAEGQAAVIRKAYRAAGLSPLDTRYVEAHGTGTPVGDPIELDAISRVFYKPDQPTLIGSIKPSLGHSEAASGLASVIKAVLSLENSTIPPTIGVTNINPNLKLEERNARIITTATQWPPNAPQRISVNSFGYGGANAHCIIESAAMHKSSTASTSGSEPKQTTHYLVPVSAKSRQALELRIHSFLSSKTPLYDIAHTLGKHREQFPHRSFILSDTISEGVLEAAVQRGSTINKKILPIAFVFTGQGAQWPRMGLELFKRYRVYRDAIRAMDDSLKAIRHGSESSIEQLLYGMEDGQDIEAAHYAQQATAAIQIALVDLLRSWNIHPSKVVGHSSGEIAAAYAAQFLSREEAIAIAYNRGKAAGSVARAGAMLAAAMSPSEASALIESTQKNKSVKVACVNSSQSVTLSGDRDDVHELMDVLNSRGKFVRLLKTNGKAYHSHHMEAIGQSFYDSLTVLEDSQPEPIQIQPATIEMMSSVTLTSLHRATVRRREYWQQNLQQPVQFDGALTKLTGGSAHVLIEIGPHGALMQPIKQNTSDNAQKDSVYMSTLQRNKNGEHVLLELAGSLFTAGYNLNFKAVNTSLLQHDVRPPIMDRTLSPYPWDHSKLLWKESSLSVGFRQRKFPRHDLLGSRSGPNQNAYAQWRNTLNSKNLPWLNDHQIDGTVCFPAAGYLAMAIEAFTQILVDSSSSSSNPEASAARPNVQLKQVKLVSMLTVPQSTDSVELLTTMHPYKISSTLDDSSWWRFSITSTANEHQTLHATGCISLLELEDIHPPIHVQKAVQEKRSNAFWYKEFDSHGLNFGARFQTLKDIYTDQTNAEAVCMAFAKLPSSNVQMEYSTYSLHPTTIDAALQTGLIATSKGVQTALKGYIPSEIDHLEIVNSDTENTSNDCTINARARPCGMFNSHIDASIHDSTGRLRLYMSGVKLVAFNSSAAHGETTVRTPAIRASWKPDVTIVSRNEAGYLIRYLEKLSDISQSVNNASRGDMRSKLDHILDLYWHKRPGLRVLEVYDQMDVLPANSITEAWLLGNASTQTHATCVTARFDHTQQLVDFKEITASRSNSIKKPDTNGDTAHGASLSTDTSFDIVVFNSSSTQWTQQQEFLQKRFPNTMAVIVVAPAEHISNGTKPDREPLSNGITLSERPDSKGAIPDKLSAANGAILNGFPVSNGTIVGRQPDLVQIPANDKVISICPAVEQKNIQLGTVYLIHGSTKTDLDHHLEYRLAQIPGAIIRSLAISDVPHTSLTVDSKIICTAELEAPILEEISDATLKSIQDISSVAAVVLWITGGDTFTVADPSRSLAVGVSRSLMIEYPGLRWSVLGLDDTSQGFSDLGRRIELLLLRLSQDPKPDLEYLQSEGLIYISRLKGVRSINDRFDSIVRHQPITMMSSQIGSAKLSLRRPGHLEELCFKQDQDVQPLQTGQVRIQTSAFSINAKDYYALRNRIDTKHGTCALEFCGQIIESKDETLVPGDRVVAMMPSHYGTIEVAPAWACVKLLPSEQYDDLCTVPMAFSTALYALKYRANLQPTESVLIHSASGGVGIAAIQIAQSIGATVYATVGTASKKQYLMNRFSIPEANIFDSRKAGFAADIQKQTGGYGVDVVLNSLTGPLLHENALCLSEFGRWIEIGKRDILESGNLDMHLFEGSKTFTAFDLTDLYWSHSAAHNKRWASLLAESVELLRQGEIRLIEPRATYDATEIAQAFRCFGDSTRMGKVVVRFDTTMPLKVLPKLYLTSFSADKTYLLIGGLGGLGQRIARWMYTRGARSFAFIGPTGDSRPSAKALIQDLNNRGARTIVVQGSVVDEADVRFLFSQIGDNLGGILHTAMSVHASLFKDATSEMWRVGIGQKVQGCWTLLRILNETRLASPLEFFVVLSSVSGTVGVATEGNYSAANSFLDNFVRYLRQQGLPGMSIGLGMISDIGFMAEHSAVEESLLRQGVQPYTEHEMFQLLDMGMTPPISVQMPKSSETMGDAPHEDAHFFVGLELAGFEKLRKRGFGRVMQALNDVRCGIVGKQFTEAMEADSEQNNAMNGTADTNVRSRLLQMIGNLAKSENDQAGKELEAQIQRTMTLELAKILSGLLHTDADLLQHPETILVGGGMDSMLAPEARSDIFRAFGVDIPFTTMMDPNMTVGNLCDTIRASMLKMAVGEHAN